MNAYFQQIFFMVGINLIAVLGLCILTGFTGLFSFGHGGFMAIGAYISAIVTAKLSRDVDPGRLASFPWVPRISYEYSHLRRRHLR